MGVGNHTSQKVNPIKHYKNKSSIGKVGKNPTCLGRTKGNVIRRGNEYHRKPGKYNPTYNRRRKNYLQEFCGI